MKSNGHIMLPKMYSFTVVRSLVFLILLEIQFGSLHGFSADEVQQTELKYELSKLQHLSNQTSSSIWQLTANGFYLWTMENPKDEDSDSLWPGNQQSIIKSHFQIRKTFIIIHGFLGNGLEDWVLSLKDRLLLREDCNVVSVDWPAGIALIPLSYYLAVNRVPYVGLDTANLLQTILSTVELNLLDVHFIGHSLGAHISGFASKRFNGLIGRITGLDPAGPQFHRVKPSQRLDYTDAVYVDVMHTNGCTTWREWTDCFGIDENLGHSDFWPNGGEHQPYCKSSNNLSKISFKGDIGCDHGLAYIYFTESVDYRNNDTYFLSRPCKSWDLYVEGNCSCGSERQYMGYSANIRINGTFYLPTNSRPPFAKRDSACLPINPVNNFRIIIATVSTVTVVGFIWVIACGVLCWKKTPIEIDVPLLDDQDVVNS